MKKYDLIVAGAGHAGIEAAYAGAKMGCSVLLLALDTDCLGKLSCNPAIGGVAKGALVRETDALGGIIAKIADQAAIGYRILNRSKGKAVWATRAQVDMDLYPRAAKKIIEKNENISLLQARAEKIILKNKKISGIGTNLGNFYAKCVIIAAGTFLKSKIHIGLNSFPGGRLFESSSDKLFYAIKKLGFQTKHFKTGTCARIDKSSVDFDKMQKQDPEFDVSPFSFSNTGISKDTHPCYITYTNKKTHRIIKKNLKFSPLYSGKIKSTGVRYCPSLEDKIVKFPEKERHQVFIEPQGLNSKEVYPNGISTSLPFEVQVDFIRSIEGLEKAKINKPGYGIEHGIIDARQLSFSLESRQYSGLFFAGQLNGTTGYEEAAAQGLVAGVNAALKVKKEKPFILGRSQAYVGVMIDDLVRKGVDEPYRMFTSRSEFRLSLRESNADLRLAPIGLGLGLIGKNDYQVVQAKHEKIKQVIAELKSEKIKQKGRTKSVFEFLKEPKVNFSSITKKANRKSLPFFVKNEIEITAKYQSFLLREKAWLKELGNLDKIKMPKTNYLNLPCLSREVAEKLNKFKPSSLGQALQISGVTPAAILAVHNFIKNKQKK